MPVLFVGHGSPMNAIEENEFTKGWATQALKLAIPTPEHFLPLLYTLALKEREEEIRFFNDKAVMGSLTMTSVLIGKTTK